MEYLVSHPDLVSPLVSPADLISPVALVSHADLISPSGLVSPANLVSQADLVSLSGLVSPAVRSTTPPAGKLRKTSEQIATIGEYTHRNPTLPREILLQTLQEFANTASLQLASFLDLLSASMVCTEWYVAVRVLLPADSLRDPLSLNYRHPEELRLLNLLLTSRQLGLPYADEVQHIKITAPDLSGMEDGYVYCQIPSPRPSFFLKLIPIVNITDVDIELQRNSSGQRWSHVLRNELFRLLTIHCSHRLCKLSVCVRSSGNYVNDTDLSTFLQDADGTLPSLNVEAETAYRHPYDESLEKEPYEKQLFDFISCAHGLTTLKLETCPSINTAILQVAAKNCRDLEALSIERIFDGLGEGVFDTAVFPWPKLRQLNFFLPINPLADSAVESLRTKLESYGFREEGADSMTFLRDVV
ncbi:hypothetical protein BC936DRAFT_147374 [Jimgerdemannia flammicorona]|uniref:F-box domain-containing protein n=1 Tax=Jimgerdemannia flammicorona TaxID=994334 RepID=A0A433D5G0_9FUNG|nr:hypothetical protein BC936DRAFT_147374 [Jimgerdemannia flammicorona]